jgi:spermidine synthase
MYYDYDLAALYMSDAKADSDTDVLILGNCCGTYATELLNINPDINVEGVEIDERISELAYEYFDMSQEVKVTTYDGRAYLNTVDEKYDVIMVDAYQDITIPFQMSSIEFFQLVKDHLKPGGVMVVNMNMRGNLADPGKKDADINLYLQDTIAEVFGYVYTVDVSGYTNRELFATDNADALSGLDRMINEKAADSDDLILLMERVRDNLVSYQGSGHIFTDDKAPVELYGMRVIDDLIRDEVDYYKEIYKNEGLQGLIDNF